MQPSPMPDSTQPPSSPTADRDVDIVVVGFGFSAIPLLRELERTGDDFVVISESEGGSIWHTLEREGRLARVGAEAVEGRRLGERDAERGGGAPPERDARHRDARPLRRAAERDEHDARTAQRAHAVAASTKPYQVLRLDARERAVARRIPEAQAAGGGAAQAGASLFGAAVGKVAGTQYCPESSSEEYSLSDNDGEHEGGKVAVTV